MCDNCADHAPSTLNYVLAAVAVGSLLVTLGSLVVAARALRLNRENADVAARERGRRAGFSIELTAKSADWSSDGEIHVLIGVGVSNTGDLAAGRTGINLAVPEDIAVFKWEHVVGEQRAAEPAPERLGEGADARQAKYIDRELDRVGVRGTRLVRARAVTTVPRDAAYRLPVRARVWADELPDRVEERVADRTFLIRWANGEPEIEPTGDTIQRDEPEGMDEPDS